MEGVAAVGEHHALYLIAGQLHQDGVVVEGVHFQYVANGDVALRMRVDAHTARILNTNLRVCFSHEGVAHHTAQFLAGFEGCVGDGQNLTQRGIVVVESDHLLDHSHSLGEFSHVDIFCLLVNNLTVFQREGDIGHTVQLVLVLCDQYAIRDLVAFQLGMGMTADDEVEPGELLCHLDVVGIA